METRQQRPRVEKEGSLGTATNICINDVISLHDAEKGMYCRLCASVNNDAVSIFGEEGIKLNLAGKINMALPIWVSSNMGPPLNVCRKCIANLDATFSFINQVAAAQKKINTVFKVLQDISKYQEHSTWNRHPNIPAFITYYRAKNFKKLDTISRAPNHETEKENEGGELGGAVNHTPKKVGDKESSCNIEKSLSTGNQGTASDPPCVLISDDDISEGDNVKMEGDDFIETDEDVVDTHVTSSADNETIQVVVNQENCVSGDPSIDTKISRESLVTVEGDVETHRANIVGYDTTHVVHQVNEGDCVSGDPRVNTKSSKEAYENVCKYCNRSFKWNAELLFHHTSAHQDVVFCCRVCFKVFYDDKEVFKNHVKSHSVSSEVRSTEESHESPPSTSDVNNAPSEERSCSTLSQINSQDQVRLNYICKYCSEKYSKLHDLFCHQTVVHSDLVFRCTYCSKVFYENEEELIKHEECHGVHRTKYKSSEGDDTDDIPSMNNHSSTKGVYSNLTEKQQEWVNKILSDKPKKKVFGCIAKTNFSHSVNENSNISSTDDANANASLTDDVKSNISPSDNVNDIYSPPVNISISVKVVDQNNARPLSSATAQNLPSSSPIKVSASPNVTQLVRMPFQRFKMYVCKGCQLEFKTREERESHRFFHHRFKLPCRFCPRTVADRATLFDHEDTHFKKPRLTCRKCEEVFDNMEEFKKHKRTHCGTQDFPRYSCQICKRLYMRESHLKIHLETHLDERPFLCEKCGQCFKDVSSLMEHRSVPCKSKGFTRGYECDICERKFHNARLLASHRIRQHKAIYPCPLCGLVFRCRSSMSRHMKSHSRILCLVCNQAFDSLDNLQNHRKREHPEEDMTEFAAFEYGETKSIPRLMCEVCDKCFATELTLDIHKATHSNESAWQCRHCVESFDSKSELEVHMSSHPDERPHKCDICDQTFMQHKSLVQHQKVHFQDKCQICEKCGKSFLTTIELSKHMAVHPSYDVFTCTFCPMSFSRKISLLIHQRTHTNKVYSCSICSEHFSQRKLVEQHERTHARNEKDIPVTSTGMAEDSPAVSLLSMGEVVIGTSVGDHVLEEVISSANDSSNDHVGGKNIVIDSEYSEVVYVSSALDSIL